MARPRPSHGRGGPSYEGNARDKAVRSIFVANVAFETTEEQLRAVLSEVGPVVSLKLISDPATGKPRGFGFCEYEDGETAMSAVRNLAGREVNGRPLRIDSATNAPGEGPRGVGAGPSGAQGGPIEPPVHGPPVPPETAPEAITKAVASLPPEQMFELMKQMKWFIQHNPQEARQLLLHNPQLAYALLQAQVVMRIVDLETAQKLLHRAPRGPSLHPPPPEQPSTSHLPPPRMPDPGRSDEPYGGRERYPPPRGDRYGAPPPHDHYGGRQARGPPHHDMHGPPGGPRYAGAPPRTGPPEPPHARPPHPPVGQGGMTPQDQERAALIMQVLSLTDDQIRSLPPEQRDPILQLKEQIAESH